MKLALSFVIDNLPLHYYQAELLLYSLKHSTSFDIDDLFVQCTDRVEDFFLEFLSTHGYKYIIIEPYLDGTYCNKLQQLTFFLESAYDGVFLLDADMIALEDFSQIATMNTIAAKVVDASNPPMTTLTKIYDAAKIDKQDKVSPDWETEDKTMYANCNGGFYYIPKDYLETVHVNWRKWASWLYDHQELFENRHHIIHIDQISFSMTINELNLPFSYLNANNNCPIHIEKKLSSINYSKPISLLHYHREIDDFGYISDSKVNNLFIKDSIKQANKILEKKGGSRFFLGLKKYQREGLSVEDKNPFYSLLATLTKRYPTLKKLYLHYGTPKTGSTSLQFSLNKDKEELTKHGILYPSLDFHTDVPKHQWLVEVLKNESYELLENYLEAIFKEAQDKFCSEFILSTEGLYNHWSDFSQKSKLFIKALEDFFVVKHIIFFRKPEDFLKSYYQQNLKNPKIKSIPCYGHNLTVVKMLEDPWFLKHFDYIGFLVDLELYVKRENILIFNFSKNIVLDFYNFLGLEYNEKLKSNENTSLGSMSVSLLREINKVDLQVTEKKEIVALLLKMNTILSKYDTNSILDSEDVDFIKKLTMSQEATLYFEYGIEL